MRAQCNSRPTARASEDPWAGEPRWTAYLPLQGDPWEPDPLSAASSVREFQLLELTEPGPEGATWRAREPPSPRSGAADQPAKVPGERIIFIMAPWPLWDRVP